MSNFKTLPGDNPNTDPQALLLSDPPSSHQEKHEQLDPLLFTSLIKQLNALIVKSSSTTESSESRLEVSNQANQLRSGMARAEQQVQHMTAGDLSLKDQEELIKNLEQRVELERDLLRFMNNVLPTGNLSTPEPSPVQPSTPTHATDDEVRMEV